MLVEHLSCYCGCFPCTGSMSWLLYSTRNRLPDPCNRTRTHAASSSSNIHPYTSSNGGGGRIHLWNPQLCQACYLLECWSPVPYRARLTCVGGHQMYEAPVNFRYEQSRVPPAQSWALARAKSHKIGSNACLQPHARQQPHRLWQGPPACHVSCRSAKMPDWLKVNYLYTHVQGQQPQNGNGCIASADTTRHQSSIQPGMVQSADWMQQKHHSARHGSSGGLLTEVAKSGTQQLSAVCFYLTALKARNRRQTCDSLVF